MGIEEEGNARLNGMMQRQGGLNLDLLHDTDLDKLESKMTSVSSKR